MIVCLQIEHQGGGYRKTRFNIHQHIWIITVFVLVISLMVGYAVMDHTLDVNGTSKITATTLIRITNIKHVDSNATGEGKIEGNIKGIIPTEFSGDGSTSYQVIVKNEGSTSGILSTINLVNESNNKNPSCITMKIEGLQVGDILTPSQEQTFTVTVTNTCGGSGSKENEFSLSYIPVNGGGDTTTIDEKINLLQTQITSLQEENEILKQNTSVIEISDWYSNLHSNYELIDSPRADRMGNLVELNFLALRKEFIGDQHPVMTLKVGPKSNVNTVCYFCVTPYSPACQLTYVFLTNSSKTLLVNDFGSNITYKYLKCHFYYFADE